MNQALHDRYIQYLAQQGLRPRVVPKDARLRRANQRDKFIAAAKVLKGELAAQRAGEALLRKEQEAWTDDIHPAEFILREQARRVEETIRLSNRYRRKLQPEIFVGEFPTGSINAEVVRVHEGFLVLVNSGLLIATSQISNLLAPLESDGLPQPTEKENIEAVISVLYAYLQFGDPFLGPTTPIEQQIRSVLPPGLIWRACLRFVIAHEYAHILAGHLDVESLKTVSKTTRAGAIEVARKSWEEEYEADLVAQQLLLGIDDDSEINGFAERLLKFLTKGQIRQASDGLASIAAPFFVLTIDSILADVHSVVGRHIALSNDASHPPAGDRMDRLMNQVEHFPSECHYLMPTFLWQHASEIGERLSDAILQTSKRRRGDWGEPLQAATDEMERVLHTLDELGATSKETAATAEQVIITSGSEAFRNMVSMFFKPPASVLSQTMLIGQFIGRVHQGRRIASLVQGTALLFWVEKAEELL